MARKGTSRSSDPRINRIPFARSNGPYAKASNQDMLTTALDGLIERTGIARRPPRRGRRRRGAQAQPRLQPDPGVGARRRACAGETPAYDVGQACGTGLETAILVANKIALGQIESGIACGVDTTSDAPVALNDDLRQILLEANSARSNLDRIRALAKVRPGTADPGDAAQRRTAHRPLDGRAHRDHGPRVGNHPRCPGRADRRQPPASRRRLRERLRGRPRHRPISASSATRTCARTPRSSRSRS